MKSHRAANETDYESWREDDINPTVNVFDVGDIRATTIIVDPITFAWQNGGGYGNANDGLAITTDGASPMTTSQVQAVAYEAPPQKYTVRRLTPTECERLQGFPDGHTEFRADGKRQSDTQRYKQLGNAVTVNVAEYVAALIMHADEHYLPPRIAPTLAEIQAATDAKVETYRKRLDETIDAGGPFPMDGDELAEMGITAGVQDRLF